MSKRVPVWVNPNPRHPEDHFSYEKREGWIKYVPEVNWVLDSKCNYMTEEGRICNKCGRKHDGKPGQSLSSLRTK